MNKIIKFGIVGLGNIGKRHHQHIDAHPFGLLVAVCDIDSRKKDGLTIPFYSDLTEMISREQLDVICICTPNYLHAPQSILALENCINVVCEKPMANSLADAEAMIASAEKTNKTIFVVKQNRYNPPVQEVKKLINNNTLGKIFFVNVNCYWNRNDYYYNESNWRGKLKEDGGCLYTQFSHFVDIIYYLFGDVIALKSLMNNFNHHNTEVEDTGTCILELKSGGMVNFNFTTNAFNKNMEGAITIIAEHGTLKIGGQYLNTIEYQQIKETMLPAINISEKNNNYGQYQGSMSNHDLMIDNVIQTLNGKATIMTNAYEGRDVVKIISDMYAVKI
jgi:UDP-N-acetyl-2-amino-2-deoxyglucuronate dehydrogenase